MAVIILLRILQFLCIGGIVIGGFQFLPLSSEIGSVFEGQPLALPRLCGRIAAFTGPVAVALIVMALLEMAIRHTRQESRLKAAHPTEPWLWKPQWAAKHMRLSNKPLLIAWLCVAVLYLLVGVPLAVFTEKQPLIIFAAVLGGVLLLALRMLWMGRQWNRAELRIATLPGVVGGPFSGAVILQQTFPPDTVFDANLKCQQSSTHRRGKTSETKHTDLWSSTIYVQHPLPGSPKGTTALPVAFAIPFDAQPTRNKSGDVIRWILSVQKKEDVSTGGASFEIPVYCTADSRRNYQLDPALMRSHLATMDPAAVLKRFALKTQNLSAEHVRYQFREFDFSIFATLIVMSLMLIGALVPMWLWIKDGNTRFFAMMFPVVFLLMFLYGIIHMLFWRSYVERFTSLAADQPETLAELERPAKQICTITAESGILGFRKSIRVIGDRTTVLRCKLDHRANNQESWSVWLCAAQGDKLKILGAFRGASEAHAAAKYLAEMWGISASGIKAEDGFL